MIFSQKFSQTVYSALLNIAQEHKNATATFQVIKANNQGIFQK